MEGECAEEGWLLVRVHVPELNVQKSLQFSRDQLVWDVKQQCLAALPKVATWYRVCHCLISHSLCINIPCNLCNLHESIMIQLQYLNHRNV
ncbi:unnamed protein product, partial [Brenthis ino]